MIEIIGTLFAIATTLGLSRAIDELDTLSTKQGKISADDVIRSVGTMINEARSKGSKILSKLQSRLDNVEMPFGRSPQLNSYLTKVRRDLNRELTNTQDQLNMVENKLSNIQDRANSFTYLSDASKNNFKNIPENLKQETQEQIDKLSEIERSIKYE